MLFHRICKDPTAAGQQQVAVLTTVDVRV